MIKKILTIAGLLVLVIAGLPVGNADTGFAVGWTGDGGSISPSQTLYAAPFGDGSARTTETEALVPAPYDFTATNFTVLSSAADCGGFSGAGEAVTVTLRKNQVDTALTGSCANGAAALSFTVDTDDVSFTAGDAISIEIVRNAVGILANTLRIGVSASIVGFGGPPGPTGATGAAGSNGVNGRDAGLKYTYSTTTTASDPGAGFLRFNNAALGSATALYISETDGDSVTVAAFLATMELEGGAFLTIIKDGSAGTALRYFINPSGLTDNGAWDTISLGLIGVTGTLANNDIVKVHFTQRGAEGETGADGNPAGNPWFYGSGTCASVGSQSIRFNSATPSLVTQICISETDRDSVPQENFIESWDDSTNPAPLGHLLIRGPDTFSVQIYAISGTITDSGTFQTIPVTYVTSVNTFTNGNEVFVQFARTGNLGAPAASMDVIARQLFGPLETNGNVSIYARVEELGVPTDVIGDMVIQIHRVTGTLWSLEVTATMDHLDTGLYVYNWTTSPGRFNILTQGNATNGIARSDNPVRVDAFGITISEFDSEVATSLGLFLPVLIIVLLIFWAESSKQIMIYILAVSAIGLTVIAYDEFGWIRIVFLAVAIYVAIRGYYSAEETKKED